MGRELDYDGDAEGFEIVSCGCPCGVLWCIPHCHSVDFQLLRVDGVRD